MLAEGWAKPQVLAPVGRRARNAGGAKHGRGILRSPVGGRAPAARPGDPEGGAPRAGWRLALGGGRRARRRCRGEEEGLEQKEQELQGVRWSLRQKWQLLFRP